MLPSYWLSCDLYVTVYSISGQCNAGTFYSLFVWVMILSKLKPNIYFRGKSKEDKKPLHIILIVLLFIMSSKQIHNCSTPNSAPTSADLSQCTAVRGSIIIHHCTLLHSLSTLLSLLVLQPFTPKANRKKWFTRPHKRFWAEISGISSNNPNLIFGPLLVNPIGSSN